MRMVCVSRFLVGMATVACALVGCVPAPQENTATPEPTRELIETKAGASVYRETGVEDAVWLEVDRSAESGGPVGGYLTEPENGRSAFVLLLQGANPGGMEKRLPHTLDTHRMLGGAFVEAGFTTWTPYIPECGIPYGQGDLQDTLAAMGWLDGGGAASYGAERVYVVGYSKGATLATLANLERSAAAYVSLNGLTQPNQLEENYAFYQTIVTTLQLNEGFCQMKSTLDAYGPPGSEAWNVLDAVSKIGQLHSPELFVHDLGDYVYSEDNTIAMQQRYEAGVAAGESIVPLEFLLLENVNHFDARTNPDIHQHVVDYLMQFEPTFP